MEQKGKERDDKIEKYIKMIEDFVHLLKILKSSSAEKKHAINFS